MNYGHMIDGELVKVTFPIKYNGRDHFTKKHEELLSLGEKEIVYTDKPNSGKGKYKESWRETDTQIVQEWTFEAYSEEETSSIYRQTVNKRIREKYSVNQELEILRNYLMHGETCKAAFEEYNEYVESCKENAHMEIYSQPYTRPGRKK